MVDRSSVTEYFGIIINFKEDVHSKMKILYLAGFGQGAESNGEGPGCVR